MPLFVWEDKYKVGVKEFDEQHKKLIELINKLYDAMKQGHGKDVLKSILNDLFEYTKYHFETEEKYFSDYNYPDKNEHVKVHNELRNKVIDLKNKLDNGTTVISGELMKFLKEWLVNHIMDSDKKYGTFFNERGVF